MTEKEIKLLIPGTFYEMILDTGTIWFIMFHSFKGIAIYRGLISVEPLSRNVNIGESNNWGNMTDVKSIRKCTPKEIDWMKSMIASNKFIDYPEGADKDLINDNYLIY